MNSADRELLIEIGCEELPAAWLPALTAELGVALEARLREARLAIDDPAETCSTPRRLTVTVARVADRQTDLQEVISGPPVSAAFKPDGSPTPAAVGFARKHGVEIAALGRQQTAKGEYLIYEHRQRGRAAIEVLPDVLAAVLRDLTFPKQMRWDAWLDDGRGELAFGRPIRWLLFLYGGRVVPFTIHRSEAAQHPAVQEVRSAAATYGHRFLAGSGRPGRALRVRSYADYKTRLAEHGVILAREERHQRIARELDAHARRLGGRVAAQAHGASLLQEVADLVEYPDVVAGTFPTPFLELPEEVLTTTMIHHQHDFPVVGDDGRLMPAFLVVTNIEVEDRRKIAVNAGRVLTARLRDAAFFWDADRAHPLASRMARLDTVLFHQKLGSYRAKAERIERLAGWIATEALKDASCASHARTAGRLAKADLTTEMVRELTELQGVMGGVYAREEGYPEEVWKAIYFHYLPVGVELGAPPSREQLGPAATVWAALSIADKVDSVVGMFAIGERPTGTRDPFGVRRAMQGVVKVLYDPPELTGRTEMVDVDPLFKTAAGEHGVDSSEFADELGGFFEDRLRHLCAARGFRHDEIEAALGARAARRVPLAVRRRLEALQGMRQSADFEALAVAFKRVRNLAREVSAEPQARYDRPFERHRLVEPAERELVEVFDRVEPRIGAALAAGDFGRAMLEAASLRPHVDRFFTDIFVMGDDTTLRDARLMLLVSLRDLMLQIADISQLAAEPAA